MRHTRLAKAAHGLTELIGAPKTIGVACWSKTDWPGIAHDGDSIYSTYGLFVHEMPHWVHLSPGTCRAIETLLHSRPQFPNVYTADALETLTHEIMHAIGVDSEAAAECSSMQLSPFIAGILGVPAHYAMRLAAVDLQAYGRLPPSYRDKRRCRENGEWDLFKGKRSPPWHAIPLGLGRVATVGASG
jgi:hypothetical protein